MFSILETYDTLGDHMKKGLILLLIFFLNLSLVKASEYSVKNYIVYNPDTKQILEGKQIHQVQSIASISKIMTAIIAIENCPLEKIITLNDSILKAYGSAVYIHIGDQISMQDLLYALLLRSGNDAALAIANEVGQGDNEKFVEMMNKKATELKMEHTHFSNPSGLDEEDDGNLSCVYDMAILMGYCINNPIFCEIIHTQNYKREDHKGSWQNKNKLLSLYENCLGGKTGYTKKAKRTLINAAIKDGIRLICVTFNCGDDFYLQKNLFEKNFALYKPILIFNEGTHILNHYQFELDQPLIYPALKEEPINVSYEIKNQQIYLKVNQNVLTVANYEYLQTPILNEILFYFKVMLHE